MYAVTYSQAGIMASTAQIDKSSLASFEHSGTEVHCVSQLLQICQQLAVQRLLITRKHRLGMHQLPEAQAPATAWPLSP